MGGSVCVERGGEVGRGKGSERGGSVRGRRGKREVGRGEEG